MQGITNAVTSSENSELYYTKSETNALLNNKASTSLDNLSSAGQMIIDSQNGTISNCVLEIPQNLKLTLENNVLTLKVGSVITNSGLTYQTVTTTQDYTSNISSSLADGKYLVFVRISDFAMPIFNINKCCSGATDSIEAGDQHIWFDTNTKEVKQVFADSTYAQRSYPICLIEMKSGVASFAKNSNGNDMIFNGACFVGHHAVIYPNVKGLAPKGFNDDRTLSNLAVNTNALSIQEMSTFSGRCIGFQGGNNVGSFPYKSVDTVDELEQQYIFQYCSETNTVWLWSNNAWSKDTRRCPLASYNYNGTTVTDFTIRQPVRTATVEMLNSALGDVETLLAAI